MDEKKYTVMVIDDNAPFREGCLRVLKMIGLEAVGFGDGAAALSWLASNEAAAALLDIRMPGMSGYEVLSRMRAISPGTAVVMATAYADVDAPERLLSMGARDIVTKPVEDMKVIPKTVVRALARSAFSREGKIGDSLLQKLLLSIEALDKIENEAAVERSRTSGVSYYRAVRDMGLLEPEDVLFIHEDVLGLARSDLSELAADGAALPGPPAEMALKHWCAPLFYDGDALVVAVTDVLDSEALAAISNTAGSPARFVWASESDVASIIRDLYRVADPDAFVTSLENRLKEARGEDIGKVLARVMMALDVREVKEFSFHRVGEGAYDFTLRSLVTAGGDRG